MNMGTPPGHFPKRGPLVMEVVRTGRTTRTLLTLTC
jgi:hypothetical protein